jgi:RNA polymerase sigma-70 factor (ECF subfamily)
MPANTTGAGESRSPSSTGAIAPAEVLRLTSELAAGSETAFNRIYEAFFDPLYRTLLVRARGEEDLARDALQETLLRVIRYAKPLPTEGDLWNWLRRLAKTALIDEGKRRRRKATADPLPPAVIGEIPGKDDASGILVDRLRACLDHLAEEERRLVEGKYFEGKSVKDLAREENTTPKAVESRLSRIRAKLRGRLMERLSHGP